MFFGLLILKLCMHNFEMDNLKVLNFFLFRSLQSRMITRYERKRERKKQEVFLAIEFSMDAGSKM